MLDQGLRAIVVTKLIECVILWNEILRLASYIDIGQALVLRGKDELLCIRVAVFGPSHSVD